VQVLNKTDGVFDADDESLASVLAALAHSRNAAQAMEAFVQWAQLRRQLGTWASLTELRFQEATHQPQYKAAVDELSELRPKVTGLDVAVKRALLASPLFWHVVATTLTFAAAGCFAVMLAVTLALNMPINVAVLRWDEEGGDPDRWRRLRRRE